MGGAQPLAAVMAGATFLAAEVDPARIAKRLKTRYLDDLTSDVDEAIRALERSATRRKRSRSDGPATSSTCCANRARRNVVPDVLTDQTSRRTTRCTATCRRDHLEQAASLRASDPAEYVRRSKATMAEHVLCMLELQRRGSVAFDYGNNLRGHALRRRQGSVPIPGFVPEYIRPLFCEGQGAVPLGGAVRRSRGHRGDRRSDSGTVPARSRAGAMDRHGARAHRLPRAARAHLLARLRRSREGGAEVQRDGRQGRS
jgi:urocanate hydratase